MGWMPTLCKALWEKPRAYYLIQRQTCTQENSLAREGRIYGALPVTSRAKVQRREGILWLVQPGTVWKWCCWALVETEDQKPGGETERLVYCERTVLSGTERRLELKNGGALYHGDKGHRVFRVPIFPWRIILLPYGFLDRTYAIGSKAGFIFQRQTFLVPQLFPESCFCSYQGM